MLFHIFANTTSKLVGPELPQRRLTVRVVRRAELTLRGWVHPEQSFYSGVFKRQDTPMELEDVGNPLIHSFSIFNEGPSAAPKVQLDIYLPLMLDKGSATKEKYLQYLEERPIIENGQGECVVQPQYVNHLNLSSKLDTSLQRSAAYLNAPASLTKWPYRSKQQSQLQLQNKSYHSHHHAQSTKLDLELDVARAGQDGRANRLPRGTIDNVLRMGRFADILQTDTKPSQSKKQQQIIELNCDKATAICIKIQCEFYGMPAKTEAQVSIKARLWNSTLVSEYPRVDLVRIISVAKVLIPKDFGVQQTENNDRIQVRIQWIPRDSKRFLILILILPSLSPARWKHTPIPSWWISSVKHTRRCGSSFWP